jgi:hypothetical protein
VGPVFVPVVFGEHQVQLVQRFGRPTQAQ